MQLGYKLTVFEEFIISSLFTQIYRLRIIKEILVTFVISPYLNVLLTSSVFEGYGQDFGSGGMLYTLNSKVKGLVIIFSISKSEKSINLRKSGFF